jgi:hypothetical protein
MAANADGVGIRRTRTGTMIDPLGWTDKTENRQGNFMDTSHQKGVALSFGAAAINKHSCAFEALAGVALGRGSVRLLVEKQHANTLSLLTRFMIFPCQGRRADRELRR